jgi:hypothetical protein
LRDAGEAAIKEQGATQRTDQEKNSDSPGQQAYLTYPEQGAIYHGRAYNPVE